MFKKDLRLYVEHLLRGNFDPAEVMQLLLFARDEFNGRQSVREIGNYFAHISERDQGPLLRETKALYDFLRWRAPNLDKPIELDNLPATAPDALRANLSRMHPTDLRKGCKLSKAEAEKTLETFIAKLKFKNFGLLALSSAPTKEEADVVGYVAGAIFSKGLFDGERLFNDFCGILIEQGLLEPKEKKSLEAIKHGLQLYAVAVMHRSHIILNATQKAEMKAIQGTNGHIWVMALIPVQLIDPPRSVRVGFPLFTTELTAKDYCSEELTKAEVWDFPINVTAAQMLKTLT